MSEIEKKWSVYRLDDNNNTFRIAEGLTKEDADRLAKYYEDKGHKQAYFVKDEKRKAS